LAKKPPRSALVLDPSVEPYTLEVGGVVKSLDLGACDARVDVDLSSPAGPGTCR
jgi:hypothetical protein